jgi:cation diffusion facilitator family transporter
LILTGCGIIWDSMEILLQAYHPNPSICALPVALFSILANEGLFHYTRHIGERIQSQLIIANAWHHRSDAWSSFVVLVGLIGSSLHIPHLDPASALIVGGMIIYMGWNYGWDSVKQLVDTAVEQNVLHTIEQAILQVNGVKKIHQLRTRSMGQDILIDVHILVAPYISVSEGHYIAQHVHRHLCRTIAKVSDVTVHVDPEDDEANCPSFHLPNRAWLEKHLLVPWQQTYPDIQYWLLHYLDGEVIIDLWTNNTQHIRQALQNNIHKDLQNKANHIKIRCLINNEVC